MFRLCFESLYPQFQEFMAKICQFVVKRGTFLRYLLGIVNIVGNFFLEKKQSFPKCIFSMHYQKHSFFMKVGS